MARPLLAAPCAACNTVNEVAIPVDGGRSFTVKCYSCAALNRLTVDTGGGPIVAARTPSDWRDSGGDGDSASARQQQAAQPRGAASELLAAGLASVPLKKRSKSALALSLAAGSEAAAKRRGGQSAAQADRQAPPPAPAPAPPPPQPARTSSASKKVVVRTGHDVVALFHDGYYYGGTVDDAKMSDSAGGPAGGGGRGASFLVGWDDGDAPSWVEAHNVALVSRVPLLCEMASGTRVLALWQGSVTVEDNDSEEEVWFAAEVVGAGRGAEELSLRWIDGGERFEARPEAIRTFVSSILAPLELQHCSAAPSPPVLAGPSGRDAECVRHNLSPSAHGIPSGGNPSGRDSFSPAASWLGQPAPARPPPPMRGRPAPAAAGPSRRRRDAGRACGRHRPFAANPRAR